MINKRTEVELLAQSELQDPMRLKFHIQPPIGLLNDPNGLVQHNGIFHLFYQWNPWGCEHKNKSWGHMTTKNFITFQQQPVALLPTERYDKDGCYSGSGFVKDDQVYVMYTGNVKNANGERESYQCLARVEANQELTKLGIVIDDHQIPSGYTKHFRDPKVWFEPQLQQWLMIIGAQTQAEQGTALLFKSDDVREWHFFQELTTDYQREFGYMWECPDICYVDDQAVFIFSPQGLEQVGMDYANIYQSGYVLGQFDAPSGTFTHEKFHELDRGFEFYAPQTFQAEDGRTIMLAWMGLPEEEAQPTCMNGWVHAFTLPRQLTVRNGKLYQQPLDELKALRQKEGAYQVQYELQAVQQMCVGETYECRFTFEPAQTGQFIYTFGEHQQLIVDFDTALMTLKREGAYLPGIRQCRLDFSERFTMTLFKDTSSVEIFIQNGAEVFTARTFHAQTSFATLAATTRCQVAVEYWPLAAIQIEK